MFAISIENLKKLKYNIIFKKNIIFFIVYSKCSYEYKKIFNEEQSIEILKIFGLINNMWVLENV